MGLAAEAAADLGRRHLELRYLHAKECGAPVAVRELALGRHPQLAAPIRTHAREAGMRLDVALVNLLGLVTLFDNDVSQLETCVDVAVAIGRHARDVGRLMGLILRFDPWLDNRRTRRHRLVHVRDVRQHLVVHLDEFERLACRFGITCGHGGHGVPIVQRLAPRHAVFKDVVKLGITVGEIRKVRARNDGLDPFKLLGPARIDVTYLCMRMR